MKKINLFFLAIIFAFSATAQDTEGEENTEKKATDMDKILPASGDYAIGFDATPLFNFALNAVNIMNNTGATAQHPGYVSGFNQTIIGKYFVDKSTAYRVTVGINSNSSATTSFDDHPYDSSGGEPVEYKDVTKNRSMNVSIGGGLEKRRGYGRLQGFYGGEAIIGLNSSAAINKYGLEMDSATVNDVIGDTRTLKSKDGLGFSIGLRGFVGVEYFFLPKMAVGAEFGWGFMYSINPRGSVETESWNATDQEAEIEEDKGSTKTRTSGFSVDQGYNSGAAGALKLTIHF
ncbi:MAG: hypothetical protein ACOC4J_04990 [Bacteroidota bacterium]